jgi:hypothetical protein
MAIKRFFAVLLMLTVVLGIGMPSGTAIASGSAPCTATAPSINPSIALPVTVKVVAKKVKTWEITPDSADVYRGRKSTVTVKGTKVTGKIALNPSDPITFSGKRHLGKKTITILKSGGEVVIVITFASAKSRKAVKVRVGVE